MELERDVLVSPNQEVSLIEGELVATIRELAGRGVGSKTIARTVGVARNTVRRYLRQPIAPGVQTRPAAPRLTDDARREARALYEGAAGGNAVVAQRLLREQDVAGQRPDRRASGCRYSACAPRRGARDGSRRNCAGRSITNRFRPEARPHRRRLGAGLSAGRGAELFPPAICQSVSQ